MYCLSYNFLSQPRLSSPTLLFCSLSKRTPSEKFSYMRKESTENWQSGMVVDYHFTDYFFHWNRNLQNFPLCLIYHAEFSTSAKLQLNLFPTHRNMGQNHKDSQYQFLSWRLRSLKLSKNSISCFINISLECLDLAQCWYQVFNRNSCNSHHLDYLELYNKIYYLHTRPKAHEPMTHNVRPTQWPIRFSLAQ